MIEGPDEWAVFTDPDVFGEVVTYQPQGQASVAVTAIFTAAQAVVAQGPGPGVASTEPILTLGEATLPSPPAAGDLVTLTVSHPGFPAGTTFKVAEPQPDGSGMTRLILERN
ncbi:MAG: hypothetical protein AAGL96_14570 [Pseudomonadota bacterium]